jgi:hypothetical protein
VRFGAAASSSELRRGAMDGLGQSRLIAGSKCMSRALRKAEPCRLRRDVKQKRSWQPSEPAFELEFSGDVGHLSAQDDPVFRLTMYSPLTSSDTRACVGPPDRWMRFSSRSGASRALSRGGFSINGRDLARSGSGPCSNGGSQPETETLEYSGQTILGDQVR